MVEKNTVQSQQFGAWTQLWEEGITRLGSFYEELARLEARGIDRATASVDEAAKLTKESISYATQLSAEWRRIGIEAVRRSADMLNNNRG